ncbi:MAG: FadR/GntR family transcriptional regulator [Acetobacteraceae bacterium]
MALSARLARVTDRSPALGFGGLAGTLPAEGGLVARVVTALGRAIIGGLIKPHRILPPEAELGLQFGVSRTVVREAVRVLASKGLLEVRAHTGTRVCAPEAWHRLDPAMLTWQSETLPKADFIRELFELRRMIEPEAAALAASRIDAGGIAELARAFQAMTHAGENVPAFFAADGAFHRALANSVGNTLVRALTSTVDVALQLSLELSLPAPRGQQRGVPLHRAVLEAIERRDPEAARAAMRRLIDDAEEDVRQSLAAGVRRARRGKPRPRAANR